MDGVFVVQRQATFPSSTRTECRIGGSSYTSNPLLAGVIDDFRIYADVLLETDLVELLREGKGLVLTHWYEFETPAMITDSTANNNNPTVGIAPTHKTSGCKVGTGCVLLSIDAYFSVPSLDWGAYSADGISFRLPLSLSLSRSQLSTRASLEKRNPNL